MIFSCTIGNYCAWSKFSTACLSNTRIFSIISLPLSIKLSQPFLQTISCLPVCKNWLHSQQRIKSPFWRPSGLLTWHIYSYGAAIWELWRWAGTKSSVLDLINCWFCTYIDSPSFLVAIPPFASLWAVFNDIIISRRPSWFSQKKWWNSRGPLTGCLGVVRWGGIGIGKEECYPLAHCQADLLCSIQCAAIICISCCFW